jgi:gluconate:H+ symporter, GntP family
VLSTLDTAGVVDGEEPWVQGLVLVGQTPIALLISMLMAMWLLGWKRGQTGTQGAATVNSALGPVCSIILWPGAGGMFGAVLRASGSAKRWPHLSMGPAACPTCTSR